MSTEPTPLRPVPEFIANVGYYTPPPGTVSRASCGVCGSSMNVDRNTVGPTCMASAMGGIKRAHDAFDCPRRDEPWHGQAVELVRAAGAQDARTLRWLVGEELDRLLRDNAVTLRHRAQVQKHWIQSA